MIPSRIIKNNFLNKNKIIFENSQPYSENLNANSPENLQPNSPNSDDEDLNTNSSLTTKEINYLSECNITSISSIDNKFINRMNKIKSLKSCNDICNIHVPFIEQLDTDFDPLEIISCQPIYLFVYSIHHFSKYPFITIKLIKYNDSFFLPCFQFQKNKTDCIQQCISFLKKYNISKINYKGFLHHIHNSEKRMILFFENIENIKTEYKTNQDEIWDITIYEIFYLQKIVTFTICKNLISIFKKYNSLLYLFDNHNIKIPIPTIAYYGCYHKKSFHIIQNGFLKENIISRYGPHYYFSDWFGACRYASYTKDFKRKFIHDKDITISDYGKYDIGSIIRVVLFIDNCKFIPPNLSTDNSFITKDLIKNKKILPKWSHFRDGNSTWLQKYDFIYNGRYIEDENNILHVKWCTNDLNNFFPLTYHILNNKNIPNKYELNFNDYKIL